LVQLTPHLQQQLPVQSKVGSGDHPLTMPAVFKILQLRQDKQLHSGRDGISMLQAQAHYLNLRQLKQLTSHTQL
jgi:hypothetical protein